MATQPLYPAYLPTRPDGFLPTLDVPYFEAEEPGMRADSFKPSIFKSGAKVDNLTPRIGTEIRGLQLSQLSKAGLDEVALLAAERGVLVFVSFRSRIKDTFKIFDKIVDWAAYRVEGPRLCGYWF